MQATVPQFIDIEDKVVGPLTIKQFLYFLAAAAVELIYWFFFDLSLFIVITIPTLAITSAFAFIKVNDRPFIYFVLAVFGFYLKPPIRIWRRETGKLTAKNTIKVSFAEGAEKREVVKAHMKRGSLSHIEKALETS
ncbi:MAG: PrgI family protein [Patescibacteria group bacterium]|nr:PrgI family protein [Patescibacteria group bacterium]